MSRSDAENARSGELFRGTIQRVTYRNPENGFGVLRVQPADPQPAPVTVVGVITETMTAGAHVVARGIWTTHPKFGRQFRAYSLTETAPTTTDTIERYLASGPIKGIGPAYAKRIVDAFGDDTLRVLDETPERLREIQGFGERKILEIREQWEQKKSLREVMLFFENFGISGALAQRIHRAYKDRSIEVVSQDPYILARDIWGIGFQTADRIAQAIGISLDSRLRIVAGLLHTLKKATEEGHCFLPTEGLIARTATLLELADTELIQRALEEAIHTGEFIRHDQGKQTESIYLPLLELAERKLGELIVDRLAAETDERFRVISPEIVAHFRSFELRRGASSQGVVQLSAEQTKALEFAAESPLLVISGGPGCGKTTVLQAIAGMFREAGLTLKLAAPTGRAAQRLGEVCDMEASTIHRLLRFDPATKSFVHDEDEPLVLDAIIVDECSMIDVQLAASLFKAIPPTARVVLVGDADQLPSVGPGLVLADLLSVREIPRVILTQLFRRKAESAISQVAHQINSGIIPEIPSPSPDSYADTYFLDVADIGAAPKLIERLVTEQIPKKFQFRPQEITVLAPMNQGELGVINLNRVLQAALVPELPGFPQVQIGETVLRMGDRVCQRVNNYSIHPNGVFNGDQGEVIGIDSAAQSVTVKLWDGREIIYSSEDLYQLDLAYALTIHRSQGSEVPAVVLALHDSHTVLLERQLLYTAVTRAKQLLVFVGTRKALAMAVKRTRSRRRYTGLVNRIQRQLTGYEIDPS